MASAVSIYVVIQTLALVSAYPSELFGGREAQAYLARQNGELVVSAVPRRYVLSAGENKPAQIGQGQQQERDDEGRGTVNLSDRNRPASDLMTQNSASPANKAPHAATQSDAQAPAPRDLFIKDCYEIDAEGRGRIDWYGLRSEAEAEACFERLAIRAGSAEQFGEILRSNGLTVLIYESFSKKNVRGLKILSSYGDAMKFFGSLNYWSNHLINPIYFLAKYITKGSYSIVIRLQYKEIPELTPEISEVIYEFEFK